MVGLFRYSVKDDGNKVVWTTGVTTPGQLRASGSARVEFISTRAVASPENDQDVLCLSIKPNGVFRFKTEI